MWKYTTQILVFRFPLYFVLCYLFRPTNHQRNGSKIREARSVHANSLFGKSIIAGQYNTALLWHITGIIGHHIKLMLFLHLLPWTLILAFLVIFQIVSWFLPRVRMNFIKYVVSKYKTLTNHSTEKTFCQILFYFHLGYCLNDIALYGKYML